MSDLSRLTLYLLRLYKNDKLAYHKSLRFVRRENDKFIFADLTNKGKFVAINTSQFPEHSWVENDITYKRIVTLG